MFNRSTAIMFALLLTIGKGWAGELVVIGGHAPRSLTPTTTSAAVYFTISNTGPADRIIAISTPSAKLAMLHESKIENDVAHMQMLGGLDIPTSSTITMSQGGLHVMLMGLKSPLVEGESLSLDVTFEKAGHMEVKVPITGLVKPAASTTP